MEFLSTARFPALYFEHKNALGENRWVTVMRATWDIAADGTLRPKASQPPIQFREVAYGDMTSSPPRTESQLAPEKPKLDVIVNGMAYAPADEPARHFDVGLSVREANSSGGPGHTLIERSIHVTGPRAWRYVKAGLLQPERFDLSEPAPVTEVPLRYDYAYGGTVQLPPREEGNTPLVSAHDDNPVGRGFVPSTRQLMDDHGLREDEAKRQRAAWLASLVAIPAPQLELPGAPIGSPETPYPVVGWGLVAKHWGLRYRHVGTLDAAWERSRYPSMPLDFDPHYWCGAHPNLQIAEVPESWGIELRGLVPASRIANQVLWLPIPKLRSVVNLFDRRTLEETTHPVRLDTVIVDLLDNELTLVQRVDVPVQDTTVYIDLDHGEWE